jgi:N-acetyl-anhydromuramyl-L-alanine amidase AmpD
MFLSTGCSLLRAEGFSCSLGVIYGGLGISKLQFLIKKIEIKFPAVNFFAIVGHQTLDPGSGLDPDPYSDPH